MLALALTSQQVGLIVVGSVAAELLLSILVALYGRWRGYPFFPLLVCAFFLGPVGWVVVLLVVTIAAGPRRGRPRPEV